MHLDVIFVSLFAVATAVALLARWLRLPYTVALVITGLALGATDAVEAVPLTKDLLYALILPGLLFEAAFHLEFRRFKENALLINSLAVPGIALTVGLTAVILVPIASALEFEHDFSLIHGLVFASIIGATDPIAVVGLFKSLGAPLRLRVIVEGESLLNDGTSIVVFTLILAFATGQATSTGEAVLDFIRVVGMGITLGAAVGLAVTTVIQRVDDAMIEITLTTIGAYGAFVLAEHFHFSGVIATVTAGMLCGNYAVRTGMSPTTRVAVESFWEYVAFALNSIVFLLIGFEVRISDLLAAWQPILVAYLTVLLARGVIVFGVSALVRPTRGRVPWSWAGVLTWAGLRGALSMVLVLGLGQEFPHREFLVTITFGVVLLSILVQGMTMSPLLRRLGLVGRVAVQQRYERERGRVLAARAALRELDLMAADGTVHAEHLEALRSEYEARLREAEGAVRALWEQASALGDDELRTARRRLLLVEKNRVLDAARAGVVGGVAREKLVAEIDRQLVVLDEADAEDEEDAPTVPERAPRPAPAPDDAATPDPDQRPDPDTP